VDGDQGTLKSANAMTKQTKPPAYFTQASLLDAMVNIDLYIDDPRAKAVLGGPTADQKRGIGTGATRAGIIKTVFDRGYVEERGTMARGSAFVTLARRLVPWMVNPFIALNRRPPCRTSRPAGATTAPMWRRCCNGRRKP
jgi:DNA topoisomerase IA